MWASSPVPGAAVAGCRRGERRGEVDGVRQFNTPEDNCAFFETWLRMAKNIGQAGGRW
ncbi:MAG: hypothetical protein R2873_04835 [Caldilineaceae bacterium]